MKKLHINMPREEFEEIATKNLEAVVAKSKEIRETLRNLETDVVGKEDKIRKYQILFEEMQTQLVKIQAEVYAKGTT